MFPIIGMSVHNICVHKFFPYLPPYYVMTGNISKIVFYLTNKPKKKITSHENKKNFCVTWYAEFRSIYGMK